jgi:hypothetical protein
MLGEVTGYDWGLYRAISPKTAWTGDELRFRDWRLASPTAVTPAISITLTTSAANTAFPFYAMMNLIAGNSPRMLNCSRR